MSFHRRDCTDIGSPSKIPAPLHTPVLPPPAVGTSTDYSPSWGTLSCSENVFFLAAELVAATVCARTGVAGARLQFLPVSLVWSGGAAELKWVPGQQQRGYRRLDVRDRGAAHRQAGFCSLFGFLWLCMCSNLTPFLPPWATARPPQGGTAPVRAPQQGLRAALYRFTPGADLRRRLTGWCGRRETRRSVSCVCGRCRPAGRRV